MLYFIMRSDFIGNTTARILGRHVSLKEVSARKAAIYPLFSIY